MSTTKMLKIPFNGNDFFVDIANGNMISLNLVHEIVGCPVNKNPSQWLRLPSTLNVIESMSNNMGKSHIMKSKRDKGGGTEDFPIHRLQNIIL